MYNLDKMSNETSGAKLQRNIEEYRAYIEAHAPLWQKEGALMPSYKNWYGNYSTRNQRANWSVDADLSETGKRTIHL